jgi:hypothetical protein
MGGAREERGTRATEQEGAPYVHRTSSSTGGSTTGGGGRAARSTTWVCIQGRGAWESGMCRGPWTRVRAEDPESSSHGVKTGCGNGGRSGRIQPVGGYQGIGSPLQGQVAPL